MKKLLSILITGIPALTFCQTISTDAPSVSASATSVPKGVFQIESSFDFHWNSESDSRTFTLPFNLVKYGITDKLEIRHTHSLNVRKSTSLDGGLHAKPGELGLGIKYSILDKPDNKTKMGVIGHWTVHPDVVSNTWSGTFAISQEFSKKHAMGGNVGGSFGLLTTSCSNESAGTFNASWIYSYLVSEKWSVFGEVYANYSRSTTTYDPACDMETRTFESSFFSGDIGVLFWVRENIQLDYVFGFGLDHNSYFHSLGFNIMLN